MNKLLVFLALALAGCATTRGSLETHSARLEDQSREFYSQVRHEDKENRSDRVSTAAEALIISTRDLNRAIERRATNDRVMGEFDRVSRDYKQLKESLADGGSPELNKSVMAEFDNVTEAYRAVETAMSSHHASPREASIQQLSSARVGTVEEVDRRVKLKDYWFP